jgi:SAM-dependent methyltransferase
MKIKDKLFTNTEGYVYPSTIIFRAIEFKFLIEKFGKVLSLKPAIDLGCGDGVAAKTIFNRKMEYGLDLDKLALEEAKKNGVYKKVFCSSATKIPLGDKSVRLVFSNSSMEHMRDIDGVLSEAARVSKKGGFLVFTVPTGNFKKYSVFSSLGLKRLARIYGKMRDKRLDHFHCYSLGEWTKRLKRHGFQVVDGYYYLDRKTIEYWDLLSWGHKLRLLVRGPSSGLRQMIYDKWLRESIYGYYKKAKVVKQGGAAVCVVAKRVG